MSIYCFNSLTIADDIAEADGWQNSRRFVISRTRATADALAALANREATKMSFRWSLKELAVAR